MKKMAFLLLTTTLFFTNPLKKNDGVIYFNDVNTLNFQEKMEEYRIENIKTICSYEYCDYMRDADFEKSMEIFTNRYIKKVDEETANLLKVKGIKITHIIKND